MELRLDPDLQTFRQEVRAFINEVLPPEMKERQRRKVANNAAVPDLLEWMRILNSHGRAVPHWPVEHGGCGWSPMQLFIFNEELYAADAPEFDWGGTHMLGPVLYTFGSDYLQGKFLPMIRQGATMWAQGFSEPGSGSDLASLRTSAELVGERRGPRRLGLLPGPHRQDGEAAARHQLPDHQDGHARHHGAPDPADQR